MKLLRPKTDRKEKPELEEDDGQYSPASDATIYAQQQAPVETVVREERKIGRNEE